MFCDSVIQMDGTSLGACSAQSRALPFPMTLAKSLWQGWVAQVPGSEAVWGAAASGEAHAVLMGAPWVPPGRSDAQLGGETESWGMGR